LCSQLLKETKKRLELLREAGQYSKDLRSAHCEEQRGENGLRYIFLCKMPFASETDPIPVTGPIRMMNRCPEICAPNRGSLAQTDNLCCLKLILSLGIVLLL
jgi:hypothetical protein